MFTCTSHDHIPLNKGATSFPVDLQLSGQCRLFVDFSVIVNKVYHDQMLLMVNSNPIVSNFNRIQASSKKLFVDY